MPFLSGIESVYGYGRAPNIPAAQQSFSTGLSSNNPGVSGIDVYNAGNTSNGWYWIKTSKMAASRQVYCNMTDAGGGWMLVSYNGNKQISGTNLTLRGQYYPVQWLGGQGTLSGQFSANVMDLWFNGASNQCSNLMRIASVTANAVPTVANGYIAHYVTYTTGASTLNLSTGSGVQSSGIFVGGTLMDARWSSLKGYVALSTHMTKADPDWMYNTGLNFYWNPCLPIGGQVSRNGSGNDIGGWMRTQDRDSWGLSNVAVNLTSGGNVFSGSTLAVFIK